MITTQVTPNPKIVRPRIAYVKAEPDKYILVEWPEIQNFMTNPKWSSCIFCQQVEGHPCPDSAWMVPETLYNSVYNK